MYLMVSGTETCYCTEISFAFVVSKSVQSHCLLQLHHRDLQGMAHTSSEGQGTLPCAPAVTLVPGGG